MHWPLSRRPTISLLIPYRDDGEQRARVWHWLQRYWACHFSWDAEIVVGRYNGVPFSKAAAVNEAARRARGKIFVVLDADCYIDYRVVREVVNRILVAQQEQKKLWFVPYRRLYRINQEGTQAVLDSDPHRNWWFPSPPPSKWIENPQQDSHYGHQWAALILILPAEAFWCVGGFDEKFAGWGGEDSSFMRAVDTLWALHENTDNDVFHLWHVRPGHNFLTRSWKGQRTTNVNARLAQRYNLASGDPVLMRALVEEE